MGLASARALLDRDPALQVCVVERHARVAAGQSGHNSGVIHSGIYYRPGSLKARLCRQGRALLLEFCGESRVPHRICGKILVATSAIERARLADLWTRGEQNGLQGLRWLEAGDIAEFEPQARGVAALLVPEAGVVDFGEVCAALERELVGRGVRFVYGERFVQARAHADAVEIRTASGDLSAGRLLGCAGLWADDVARRSGFAQPARIIPFRGEYWALRDDAAARVRALIYPVPDPALPFLGVHLTRDVHGAVDAGPNAVPAFAREGYRRADVDAGFLVSLVSWPGAWRLAWRQRRYIGGEVRRSLSRRETVRSLRRIVRGLQPSDLRRGPSGVRAQLVDPDGRLVDDFRFAGSGPVLHVLNAPSPAATASLAIGAHVAERLLASERG